VSKYDGWSRLFEGLDGSRHEFEIEYLDSLLSSSLPPSARRHSAWWSGDHGHTVWREFGWEASPRLGSGTVVFSHGRGSRPQSSRGVPVPSVSTSDRRLVLVGCVKTKVAHAAPAKDLYDSALWRKRRRYAESTGMPWAILSAEHGMVDPETILQPYDRYLGSESTAFRRQWSESAATQVLCRLRELGLRMVEVHAGSAYLDNGLRNRLRSASVEILLPVRGLSIGQQLAWYR
jgi:Family of unknown function (DUF6884)